MILRNNNIKIIALYHNIKCQILLITHFPKKLKFKFHNIKYFFRGFLCSETKHLFYSLPDIQGVFHWRKVKAELRKVFLWWPIFSFQINRLSLTDPVLTYLWTYHPQTSSLPINNSINNNIQNKSDSKYNIFVTYRIFFLPLKKFSL